MNVLLCAATLEASIRQEMEAVIQQAPDELQPFLAAVGKFQAGFELLLDRAQYTDVDAGRYPGVDSAALLGGDEVWQKILRDFSAATEKNLFSLTALWMTQALVEKSGQFYQQAAANSAHPATRLFFASLAETKHMLRRRVDGLMRVIYNSVWAEIGFAPFLLGKD
ncbi:MAG: hypothetical protein P4N41_19750 [Negativicutes bacterium]|nr:hypothetical protein [Negativicutes bacterium]